MKHLYLLSFLLFGCLSASAQNLVPNPSFEQLTSCPTGGGSIPYSPAYNNFPFITAWVSPAQSTPDYRHTCGIGGLCAVPNGTLSWGWPRTGNGYVGFYTNPPIGSSLPYREYVECKLTQPLVAGHVYHVSYYCNAAEYSLNTTINIYGVDKIGALFTTTQVAVPTSNVLAYTPQVTSPPGVPITDTQNWVRVQGVFQATGGEEWLTIGRFDDGLPVVTGIVRAGTSGSLSYTLLDDVAVFDLNYPDSIFTHTRALCATAYPVTLAGHSGGNAWQWSNNATTATIQAPATGTYWVRTWADTVYYVDTFHLSSAVPQTMFLPKDTNVCSGLPLNIAPNITMATYQWSTGATAHSISVNQTGRYILTATDTCGTQRDTIDVYYPLKLQLPKDTNICNGGAITISANHNFPAYSWSTGATTKSITVTQTGGYVLTVTDVCGPQKDTMQVAVRAPVPLPVTKDTMICQGVAAPKLAVAGDSIRWYVPPSGAGSFTQPVISTGTIGRQSFEVTQTSGGCESDKATLNLDVMSRPDVFLGNDTTLCDSIALLLGPVVGPGTSIRWSSGETFSPIVVRTTGIYRLTLTNACGGASDDRYVRYVDCDTGRVTGPGLQDDCLFIPNAFTPNSDGRNDRFRIISVCPLQRFRLMIVNRLGQVVYETSSLTDSWDGTFKGSPAAMDTYFFRLEYLKANTGNVPDQLKGDFMLVR